jgi:3-methyladenine DNA glycosylase AlkC
MLLILLEVSSKIHQNFAMPKTKAEAPDTAFKHLFNQKLLKRLAEAILPVYPDFDAKAFRGIMPQLEPLEMKARVRLIRDQLKMLLPGNYKLALNVILASMKRSDLRGFDLWPFAEFIQAYGLHDSLRSLDALSLITTRFTSEFAVRPYLLADPKRTLQYLEKCAKSEDEHLRRWASEGTRPRLPWGERLHTFIKNPNQALPILEILKFDDSLYVRKSVANHLNDIAKDHPDLVIQILKKWQKIAGKEHSPKISWIIRRSLRTLIKNGHQDALKLMGVSTKAKVKILGFKLDRKTVQGGGEIQFEFKLKSESRKPQKLVIDYLVHYMKANGAQTPKVFKLKSFTLPPEESVLIVKTHSFKLITTRVYHPGKHDLEIQINGILQKRASFRLLS